jgi:type IV pilus assembly protein PilO
MDFRDSKTQKFVLAALAFLVVVYFWYSRLYSPYSDQLSQKEAEFESITTDLKNVEMKAKSLDALKLEYQDLVGRYNEIEALLPEQKRIPNFLVQLHNASSQTGTRITKINPLTQSTSDFYNVVSFEVELVGGYHDFGRFISYIANFPFITNVSDVDVTAKKIAVAKTGPSRVDDSGNVMKKKETMTAKFRLSTYYVKESERLQEVTL